MEGVGALGGASMKRITQERQQIVGFFCRKRWFFRHNRIKSLKFCRSSSGGEG